MSDTPVTQQRSGSIPCELVSKDGFVEGIFDSPKEAAAKAAELWPGQEQYPDEVNGGWVIRLLGVQD